MLLNKFNKVSGANPIYKNQLCFYISEINSKSGNNKRIKSRIKIYQGKKDTYWTLKKKKTLLADILKTSIGVLALSISCDVLLSPFGLQGIPQCLIDQIPVFSLSCGNKKASW